MKAWVTPEWCLKASHPEATLDTKILKQGSNFTCEFKLLNNLNSTEDLKRLWQNQELPRDVLYLDIERPFSTYTYAQSWI